MVAFQLCRGSILTLTIKLFALNRDDDFVEELDDFKLRFEADGGSVCQVDMMAAGDICLEMAQVSHRTYTPHA